MTTISLNETEQKIVFVALDVLQQVAPMDDTKQSIHDLKVKLVELYEKQHPLIEH